MHVHAYYIHNIEIFHRVVRHTIHLGTFSSLIIKDIRLDACSSLISKDIRLDTCLSETVPLFILILVSSYLPILASLQHSKLLSLWPPELQYS